MYQLDLQLKEASKKCVNAYQKFNLECRDKYLAQIAYKLKYNKLEARVFERYEARAKKKNVSVKERDNQDVKKLEKHAHLYS